MRYWRYGCLLVLLMVLAACGGENKDDQNSNRITISELFIMADTIKVGTDENKYFCDNSNRINMDFGVVGEGNSDFVIVIARRNVTQNAPFIYQEVNANRGQLGGYIPSTFGRGKDPYNEGDVMEVYAFWKDHPEVSTERYQFNCTTGDYQVVPASAPSTAP